MLNSFWSGTSAWAVRVVVVVVATVPVAGRKPGAMSMRSGVPTFTSCLKLMPSVASGSAVLISMATGLPSWLTRRRERRSAGRTG
ncbi:hypothetical protein [Hymenobacter siberiensis]|uniref:hypothetical protein n=1 Tax=Hymenobacter siberiensis TaxID=2848396 RepID=UPI001C1E3C40|nr:hypothetical protein [Hymenobacter siberiensis]